MKQTIYLGLEEVLELHRVLIERFGGVPGVRDRGLLQSALMRPQTGYYNSLSEQAAALFQSLVSNHVFIDGNKRVGFAAMAIFLKMNGYNLRIDADEAERFLVGKIIKKKAGVEEISRWMERYLKKV